jgi:PEP-CTERM motif
MKNETTTMAELGNWYAVAAVAVAGLGLAGGLTEADAAQVVVTPVGGPAALPASASYGTVRFNLLDTTGTQWAASCGCASVGPTSFAIRWGKSSSGAGANVNTGSHGWVLLNGPYYSTSYAAKLGKGQTVNAAAFAGSSSFTKGSRGALLGSKSSSSTYGLWKPGDDKFIGLALSSVGPFSSQTIFGWAEIALGSNYQPTLVAWGYEDQGGPAVTGGIPAPEPSSLLLLASGAVGLSAYRKRREQRRKSAHAE